MKSYIDIGIISAMREEIEALLHAMDDVSTEVKGKRTYHKGKLFHKDVVIVFSRWGKVASAATATQLISDYNTQEIIFTGVAGAIQPTLNIGDIVIGNRMFQHDLDPSPLFETFEIPLLHKKFLTTTSNPKLELAVNDFILHFNQYIDSEEALEFNISQPKVVRGDIASGDQFISSQAKISALNIALPTTLCVEMEGAAVAQVCYEYDIPFSIIRIISDKANDNATIDFPRFANSIASFYALGILQKYLA